MTAASQFKNYLAEVAAVLLLAAMIAPAVALAANSFSQRETPRTQKPQQRRRISKRPVLAVAPVIDWASKQT
jgi:ABC-type spermidine/putrescine transport system permease subunit II